MCLWIGSGGISIPLIDPYVAKISAMWSLLIFLVRRPIVILVGFGDGVLFLLGDFDLDFDFDLLFFFSTLSLSFVFSPSAFF